MIYEATLSAYGILESEVNPSNGDRYLYAGYQIERAPGLYYDIARIYDPGTGRFNNEDPIPVYGPRPNLYAYVGNSPTNGTDPTGELVLVENSLALDRFMAIIIAARIRYRVFPLQSGRYAVSLTVEDIRRLDQAQRNGLNARFNLLYPNWWEDLERGGSHTFSPSVEFVPTSNRGGQLRPAELRGGESVTVCELIEGGRVGLQTPSSRDDPIVWLATLGAVQSLGPIRATVGPPTPGTTGGPATTAHGAERLADPARTLNQAELAAARRAHTLRQADGATVYIHQAEPGKFNVFVENQSGQIITTFRHISNGALMRLAINYGWRAP